MDRSNWRPSLFEGPGASPSNKTGSAPLFTYERCQEYSCARSSCNGLECTCKNSYLRYNEKAVRGCQVLRPSAQRQMMDLSGGGYARCPEGLGSLAASGAA